MNIFTDIFLLAILVYEGLALMQPEKRLSAYQKIQDWIEKNKHTHSAVLDPPPCQKMIIFELIYILGLFIIAISHYTLGVMLSIGFIVLLSTIKYFMREYGFAMTVPLTRLDALLTMGAILVLIRIIG
jgi:hypothetical protein